MSMENPRGIIAHAERVATDEAYARDCHKKHLAKGFATPFEEWKQRVADRAQAAKTGESCGSVYAHDLSALDIPEGDIHADDGSIQGHAVLVPKEQSFATTDGVHLEAKKAMRKLRFGALKELPPFKEKSEGIGRCMVTPDSLPPKMAASFEDDGEPSTMTLQYVKTLDPVTD